MPKIWELMPQETKTKVMALRHYLEKKENKGGKTMRKDGTKLVFEEADLNNVIAYEIRQYQFRNGNEMPETIVIEVPACTTGKDRNELPYAVEIVAERVDGETGVQTAPEGKPEPERGVDADGQPNPPESEPGNDGTPEEVEAEKAKAATMQPEEATEAGSENATVATQAGGVSEEVARQEAAKVGLKVTKTLDDYRCSKCNRMHVSGSKIHKSHKKYMASKA